MMSQRWWIRAFFWDLVCRIDMWGWIVVAVLVGRWVFQIVDDDHCRWRMLLLLLWRMTMDVLIEGMKIIAATLQLLLQWMNGWSASLWETDDDGLVNSSVGEASFPLATKNAFDDYPLSDWLFTERPNPILSAFNFSIVSVKGKFSPQHRTIQSHDLFPSLFSTHSVQFDSLNSQLYTECPHPSSSDLHFGHSVLYSQ